MAKKLRNTFYHATAAQERQPWPIPSNLLRVPRNISRIPWWNYRWTPAEKSQMTYMPNENSFKSFGFSSLIRVRPNLASIIRDSTLLKPLKDVLRCDPSVFAKKWNVSFSWQARRWRNPWHEYVPGTILYTQRTTLIPGVNLVSSRVSSVSEKHLPTCSSL